MNDHLPKIFTLTIVTSTGCRLLCMVSFLAPMISLFLLLLMIAWLWYGWQLGLTMIFLAFLVPTCGRLAHILFFRCVLVRQLFLQLDKYTYMYVCIYIYICTHVSSCIYIMYTYCILYTCIKICIIYTQCIYTDKSLSGWLSLPVTVENEG